MKLSQKAVDNILHIIASFDRERGIPHDYCDLETVLTQTHFATDSSGELVIATDQLPTTLKARLDTDLDDAIEGKEMMRKASREWGE